MKYTVHLYTAVRIRMDDIEANSQEEAFAKASEECDVKHNLSYGRAEDDESAFLGAMVDEVGDEEYLNTRYHEGAGAKNYIDVAGAVTKKDEHPYRAHAICCNDDIRAIVIGTEEQAQAAMEPLIVSDYQRNKWSYGDSVEYLSRLYWHTHTVGLIIAEEMK